VVGAEVEVARTMPERVVAHVVVTEQIAVKQGTIVNRSMA
jgi:hypothetical protein